MAKVGALIRRVTFGLGLAATVLAIACETGDGGEDDWVVEAPESKGLAIEALDAAAEQIGRIETRYCFTVIKDGELIYDHNYDTDPNMMYMAASVTKTFMAALVGIAESQGYLRLNDRISDWLTVLPETMAEDATIQHVLGQVSESDPVGSAFSYNSSAVIDTLGQVISVATGMPSVDYARQELLDPLNMQYTEWAADADGNAHAGAGVSTSCRDMARLGQLLLDYGEWRGQSLLSADYVYDMTQPSYPDANSNYGYLLWLNWSDGRWYRPTSTGTGPMLEGAPANVYMASGFMGQFIIVIPDANMVVTTMGVTYEIESLHTLQKVWDAIEPLTAPDGDCILCSPITIGGIEMTIGE
jgi:CubicO group peptidase (beta-lactamase class C family)